MSVDEARERVQEGIEWDGKRERSGIVLQTEFLELITLFEQLASSRQVVTGSLHWSADYRRRFGRKILAVKCCSQEVREKAPVSWWWESHRQGGLLNMAPRGLRLLEAIHEPAEGWAGEQQSRPAIIPQDWDQCSSLERRFSLSVRLRYETVKSGDPHVSIYVQAAYKQLRDAVARVCSILVVHIYCQCPYRRLHIMIKNAAVKQLASVTF